MSSPTLLEPFHLGDLTLPNRVVMAPLTRGRAGPERIPNALMAEYYVQRASAGLIVAEATTISEQANGWLESPGVYTDAMEAGWKQVTAAVHEAGGRIFLQLWHMGRASHSDFHGGRPFISNPDLVERFANGWPLAEPADMAAWYAPTGARGYTDFPAHTRR